MAARAARWVVIIVLVALALPIGRAAAGPEPSWSAAPPLAVARADVAVTVDVRDGSRIYAAGGTTAAELTSAAAERLAPGADSWEGLPDLGQRRRGAQAETFLFSSSG